MFSDHQLLTWLRNSIKNGSCKDFNFQLEIARTNQWTYDFFVEQLEQKNSDMSIANSTQQILSSQTKSINSNHISFNSNSNYNTKSFQIKSDFKTNSVPPGSRYRGSNFNPNYQRSSNPTLPNQSESNLTAIKPFTKSKSTRSCWDC
jgi:hypothetical protein